MSVLTDVRAALVAELQTWALGVTGLTWRGDLRAPKTNAAEDKPDDAGDALPMAGVSLPSYVYQGEDEPVVVAFATEDRNAVLSSGDAEASADVRLYFDRREDYEAGLVNFDRYWRWRSVDTAAAGSALAVPTTLLGVPAEVRAYLGPDVTVATPAATATRDLWVITYSITPRFPDLVEDIAPTGRQYVRVTLNDGESFGPAEQLYVQVEQNETDVEIETGESWELDNASTGDS